MSKPRWGSIPIKTIDRKDWRTPRELFAILDEEFHFTLDAAASRENALCPEYLTGGDDALSVEWSGRVWCNPPYGKGASSKLADWIRKGANEASLGGTDLVVMLVPANTSSPWFHDFCLDAEVRFLRGRLYFDGAKGPAPFHSMIVIFR